MPTLGDLLKKPLRGVVGAEVRVPGVPKLSKVLANVADGLPTGPNLPNIGRTASRGSIGSIKAALPKMSPIFRSVEERLPAGLPKVSDMAAKVEGSAQPSGPVVVTEAIAPAPLRPPALIFE